MGTSVEYMNITKSLFILASNEASDLQVFVKFFFHATQEMETGACLIECSSLL